MVPFQGVAEGDGAWKLLYREGEGPDRVELVAEELGGLLAGVAVIHPEEGDLPCAAARPVSGSTHPPPPRLHVAELRTPPLGIEAEVKSKAHLQNRPTETPFHDGFVRSRKKTPFGGATFQNSLPPELLETQKKDKAFGETFCLLTRFHAKKRKYTL